MILATVVRTSAVVRPIAVAYPSPRSGPPVPCASAAGATSNATTLMAAAFRTVLRSWCKGDRMAAVPLRGAIRHEASVVRSRDFAAGVLIGGQRAVPRSGRRLVDARPEAVLLRVPHLRAGDGRVDRDVIRII